MAAEVAGYAKSDRRENGLHLLVDVGARTLDICSFILHKNKGEDCYELLTADVRGLGAAVLHQKRIKAVSESLTSKDKIRLIEHDPVKKIPDTIEEFHSIARSADQRILIECDNEHKKACKRAIWKTFIDLKTRRDPRSSRWTDFLPVFLTGGGCRLKFYVSLVDCISEEIPKNGHDCKGLHRVTIPVPKILGPDVDDNIYQRLAVAWGLSYPDTDIGNVTRPSDISDIPKRKLSNYQDRAITKDQV